MSGELALGPGVPRNENFENLPPSEGKHSYPGCGAGCLGLVEFWGVLSG